MEETAKTEPTAETEQTKTEPTAQAEPKQKNPKRVEAGRKGAAARWAKQREATPIKITRDTDEDSPKQETAAPIRITRDVPDEDSPKQQTVNVYKNYIPLASILLLGFAGLLYKISRNKTQAPVQAPLRPKVDETDPFLMR